MREFGQHQVTALDSLGWDPLSKFRISPWEIDISVTTPRNIYTKTLIEKEDIERASWNENNFKLEKIVWPKKHGVNEEE